MSFVANSSNGGNIVNEIVVNGTVYRQHKFTSNGTFTINEASYCHVLVVGGGGAGGNLSGTNTTEAAAGGGGAGEVIFYTAILQPNTYSIVVGLGGVNVSNTVNTGISGSSSSFIGANVSIRFTTGSKGFSSV